MSEIGYVSVEDIGLTHENRKMKVIKVCKGGCGKKPAMWIDGGMHAREWITPATAIFGNNISFSSSGLGPKLSRFVF